MDMDGQLANAVLEALPPLDDGQAAAFVAGMASVFGAR